MLARCSVATTRAVVMSNTSRTDRRVIHAICACALLGQLDVRSPINCLGAGHVIAANAQLPGAIANRAVYARALEDTWDGDTRRARGAARIDQVQVHIVMDL